MKLVTGAIALLSALALAAMSNAESPWYVSGSVGADFREASDGAVTFFKLNQTISAPGRTHATYDPGVVANVAVGRAITPHFRLEDEVGYVNYTGSQINPTTTSPSFPAFNGQTFSRTSGGDYSRITESLNAFYDFGPVYEIIAPYVGAGAGVSFGRRTTGHYADALGTPFQATGTTSVADGFGLLEGGLDIKLARGLTLVPAYRYSRSLGGRNESDHIGKLGLRYAF